MSETISSGTATISFASVMKPGSTMICGPWPMNFTSVPPSPARPVPLMVMSGSAANWVYVEGEIDVTVPAGSAAAAMGNKSVAAKMRVSLRMDDSSLVKRAVSARRQRVGI
jgi:hypothetical protein